MTWKDLSLDSNKAALEMFKAGHLRSSVSRFYYAAYSAVTDRLEKQGIIYPYGRHNPSHQPLPDLVRNNLGLSGNKRRQIARAAHSLYRQRLVADYMPELTLLHSDVRDCARDTLIILREL